LKRPKLASASLLQGLIVDRHGRTMGPAHTTRSGQRFRYYATHPKTVTADGPAAYRLAADGLERHCSELIAEQLASQVTSIDEDAEAKRFASILCRGTYRERRALIVEHVRKVVIGDAELTIDFADGRQLQRTVERIRHGNDAKLILGQVTSSSQPKGDPQLLVLLKDAYRAQALAIAKPKLSLQQLAARFGRSAERYKRLLRLSYLSPNIVSAIIEARQPATLTNRFLQNLDGLPLSWAEQEQMLLG
jgi:site-specific DNA recombinase